MNLLLDADQTLLARTASDWVNARSPVSRLRELRAEAAGPGFSPTLWTEMAELGWVGMHLPEQLGGLGMGLRDLCLVLEPLGRNLAPEPFLGVALLGAETLAYADDPGLAERWLPAVAAGEALVSLAWQERGARRDPKHVATRVDGAGRLTGQKIHVLDAAAADRLLVSARDASGALSIQAVDPGSAGVTVTPLTRIDGRSAAHVAFQGAQTEARLGSDDAAALLERVLDRATIGLCAEMLGAASAAFGMTLEYLRVRRQFGAPIGSFQALQHRAARLFIELELARSAVVAAAASADSDEDLPRMASLCKAQCSDVFVHVANEAVQMHGGIGMTDEHDIGFYLKRSRACDATLGDASWHRDRWARLGGY